MIRIEFLSLNLANMQVDPSTWVSKYGNYLFSIAMLKTGKKELSEDLVQDTFLSAIRNLKGFEGRSSEKTWLTTILNNKIIDHYRKKSHLASSDSYYEQTDEAFYDHFFQNDQYSDAHWRPSSMPCRWEDSGHLPIQTKEFFAVLQQCIQKMPARLIAAFTSRFIDDKEKDEICKELDLSSSNYWVIMHRSKLLMRACLESNWFGK